MRHITECNEIFLPVGQLLLIDRIKEIGGDRIICEQDISGSWVFPLHFPGDPIFPGSLIIEGACQSVAIWAWENGLRGHPRLVRASAEFHSPVVPADRVLTYVCTVRRRQNLCVGQVIILAGGRLVASIKGSLAVLCAAAVQEPAVTYPAL